jgi:N-acetylglucosamine kinase-like BadF-type ATPase
MTVVGIDAGGSQTVALLADGTGRVIRRARGPGANWHSDGAAGVRAVIGPVLLDAVGREPAPTAVCIGMAGVDRTGDTAAVTSMLAALAPAAIPVVVNDALIALESERPNAPGVVLIAGTGSIAYGRDAHGRAARAGGWGYVLGDEGSGYWLGRQALRVVVRTADGRGEPTALTPAILAYYAISDPRDLIQVIGDSDRPADIAMLAPLVGSAAADGDTVASALLAEAARDLAGAAVAVIGRLGLQAAPLLLAGGLLAGLGLLREGVVRAVARSGVVVDARLLSADPAAGAVRLAIDAGQGRLALPVYLA